MTWWRRLVKRNELDEQLDRELRFHLEQHEADLIAAGSDPEAARRQARIDLGGIQQVRENCRDAWGPRWIEDFWQDFRYTLRSLRQRPGFSLVVALTLALGIGSTALMFTVLDGVLLKPLPYPEPQQLIGLQEKTAKATQFGNLWAFAYPNFLDLRRDALSVDLAAWHFVGGTLSRPGEPENVLGVEASSAFLKVLRVTPVQGRDLSPEDDRPGATPVALVSDALWRRTFGQNRGAIGASLVFDGRQYTIAGILPPDFRLGDEQVDLLTPIGQNTAPYMLNRDAHPGIKVWGRIRQGATIESVRSELTVIASRLSSAYPKSNEGRTFIAETLRPVTGTAGTTIWLLFAAVVAVLLIGCVNVASLLVARAVSREREMSVRVALGAGRGRLVRQCLAESVVLALSGGSLGLLLAVAGLRPFIAMWPGDLPRASEIHLDWRVGLFALAVSVASGILFGAVPALTAPALNPARALREGSRTVAGGSWRLQGTLVASELALAVVLLVTAGVLGSTLLRLSALDPGLNVNNVLVARLALSPSVLNEPDRIRSAWQNILDRVRGIPGVQAVATVDTVPMREGNNQLGYWPAADLPERTRLPLALATSVTPDYLNVMGIELRAGRFFNETDRQGSQPVVVIDETLARRAFGREPAVGKRLWIPDMGAAPVEVVGVVNHVRHWGLADDDQAEVRAQFYYPFAQVPDRFLRRWSELMSVAVRTSTPPRSIIQPLRREIQGAAHDQVIYEIRTMDQLEGATLARHRFLMTLFTAFSAAALILACVGIYGVLAFLAGQRVPEFGVRVALGARPHDIMRLILRQSLGMILAGVAAGSILALASGRLLEAWVSAVRANEPVTFSAMIAVLVAAALIASLLPARRASRIDPVLALRQD
jgi:predicted permease